MVLAFPWAALRAQAATLTAMRADSVGHRLPLDPSRVHPARLTYRTSVTRDSGVAFVSELHVEIAPTQYAGAPAWLLTRAGRLGVADAVDSLVVDQRGLRPLHWIAVHGAARLAAELTADSIFGAMSSPLGRQNIVLRSPPALLVSASAVDVVLTALPLTSGWRDSATVLVVDAGGAATAPAALAVEGEERVVVPAGEFDSWVVSLETERGSARYWISKDTHLVVRSEQVLPQLGGALLVRELLADIGAGTH